MRGLEIVVFPRSAERGSIEALASPSTLTPCAVSFHVRLSVAPLKPCGRVVLPVNEAMFPRSAERGSIEATGEAG